MNTSMTPNYMKDTSGNVIDTTKIRIKPLVCIITYVATDLAVTALCSLSLTPYLITVMGCGHFGLIMSITAISFATFGLGYRIFSKYKQSVLNFLLPKIPKPVLPYMLEYV